MSDMFPVCMLPVKGCQTLVMDPSSLLQQSLVNAVPHTIMVHWYLLWSGREFQDLTKIWPNFLTTHHWCLTCSQWVCSLWRVVRPWSWPQPAPTSLLQQSLGSTVPHTIMVHWYLLWSGREFFRIWPKSGLTFWPHIIDVWHIHRS